MRADVYEKFQNFAMAQVNLLVTQGGISIRFLHIMNIYKFSRFYQEYLINNFITFVQIQKKIFFTSRLFKTKNIYGERSLGRNNFWFYVFESKLFSRKRIDKFVLGNVR